MLDLNDVPPSVEFVKISNRTLKGMIEANFWKYRRKVFQPSKINCVI